MALRAGPRGEPSRDRPDVGDPFDPGPRHPASHRRRLLRQDLLLGREHQGVPRSRRTGESSQIHSDLLVLLAAVQRVEFSTELQIFR